MNIKSFTFGIGLGVFAAASVLPLTILPAAAYETVLVGEFETARILVAPPRNGLERTIRDGLRDAIATAPAGSRARTDAEQLYYFYGARHFAPLWLVEDEAGNTAFTPAAQGVIDLFGRAHLEGLDPADYLTGALDIPAASGDPQRLAALEGEFSAAMLRYARDAHSGRLDPASVSGYIDVAIKRVDEKALLENLSASDDPAALLMSFHPAHREFVALRDLLARHYDGAIEAVEAIPDGKLIRTGMSDPRVPLLRERLGVPVPGEDFTGVYDQTLVAAVKDFQTTMGLNPDGVVGPATIAALNGAAGATRAEIVANMERWRWMPEDLGDFHVLVNVPEYRLEVSKYGETVWETRVIVGQTRRQTPIFSDKIRHVVTNPYWNVPPTILRQDVMPRVAANPGYIASQNMELFYGGQRVDPFSVNWSEANPAVFRVRQKPGRSNALGMVKFLFPNTHDVYLHDTNSPGLFQRSMRAISSGCVRVENPFEFARALLEFEPNFTVASLESSLGNNERWFNMDQHVPVHLSYFTLRIDEDGTVRSFADIYGHDGRVIEMLGLE
ncbi:L,D-transpeptidase family protein [Pelagibacterium sediminicola]|uniref:L,D-transpeptidase family protein n=1 Tax=Pelagibacterium sediminicola TaxID=2248761 RepID=UPI0018E554A8|nr:L,D-transpeptidase family protein [Pelagibacterium sediminicola]